MKKLNKDELDFNRVKEIVAHYATTPEAKSEIMTTAPKISYNAVKLLLDETQEMLNILNRDLHVPFVSSDSLKPLMLKVKKGLILDADELEKIADFIRVNRLLKRFLLKQDDAPILNSYADELDVLDDLEQKIYRTIERGRVSNNADHDLARLRVQVNKLNDQIQLSLQHFLQSKKYQNLLQDKLIIEKDDHYTLPVKASYRNTFPGKVIDSSNNGNTVFIEPNKVGNLADHKNQVQSSITAIEMPILGMLSATVFEKISVIENNLKVITEIDVILARAKYARNVNGVKPELNISNQLILNEMCHPLLKNPVPLSVKIGKPQRGLLITGPNAGGKTVTLKTIGLSILMTEVGLFLPAKSCNIPICGHVFSLIGDQQDIDNSLSTFSGEMVKISQIIKCAKKNSLIVLDELGSGTDPNEGAALAIAILQELQLRGCIVIATTHYSSIKDYSIKNDAFATASMDFDIENLKPTYRLIMNQAGESRALWIAKKAGMSSQVLKTAKNILTTGKIPLKVSDVSFKARKMHKKLILHKGDVVFVGELNKEALFYKNSKLANKIIVFVDKKFIEVSTKRVKLRRKAVDLYPAGYNLDLLFIKDWQQYKFNKDLDRGSKKA